MVESVAHPSVGQKLEMPSLLVLKSFMRPPKRLFKSKARFKPLMTDKRVLYKVRDVAYRLELPQQLSRVHNTFHVSNLKKCISDESLVIPLEGLHVDDKLQFVEEPVEIMDCEIKRLKRSRIPIIKVRWNSKQGPEFTWEREDQFKQNYNHHSFINNNATMVNTRSTNGGVLTNPVLLETQIANLTSIVSQLTQSIQALGNRINKGDVGSLMANNSDNDVSSGKSIGKNRNISHGEKDAYKMFDEISSIKFCTAREYYDAFIPFARKVGWSGMCAISMFISRFQPPIRKKGIQIVTTIEKNEVKQDIRKKEDSNFSISVNNFEISVVNKAGKMKQKRKIRNGVIDISIGLMGIRLMGCDVKRDEFVHFDGKGEDLESLDENGEKEDFNIEEFKSNRMTDITDGRIDKGIQSKNSKEDDKSKKYLPNCHDIVKKDNGYVLCGNRGVLEVAWKPLVKMRMNRSIMGKNSRDADYVVVGINESVVSESISEMKLGFKGSTWSLLEEHVLNVPVDDKKDGVTRSIGDLDGKYLFMSCKDANKNGVNSCYWELSGCKWRGRKKTCGIYCQVRNNKWKFDIWRWPKRKKNVIGCSVKISRIVIEIYQFLHLLKGSFSGNGGYGFAFIANKNMDSLYPLIMVVKSAEDSVLDSVWKETKVMDKVIKCFGKEIATNKNQMVINLLLEFASNIHRVHDISDTRLREVDDKFGDMELEKRIKLVKKSYLVQPELKCGHDPEVELMVIDIELLDYQSSRPVLPMKLVENRLIQVLLLTVTSVLKPILEVKNPLRVMPIKGIHISFYQLAKICKVSSLKFSPNCNDEFKNDGFIVNDLEDDEEVRPDIDDEKQKKRRKKRAEEPTTPPAAAEAEPKKEVAPKPPPIGPKRDDLRDTVRLETAVNTTSHEYILDFTSEYGMPETLHPALPGPEDRIVDFPEGKIGVYTSKRPGRNTPQCYTKPLDSLKNWNNRFFWVDERVFPTVVDWRMNAPKDGMPAEGTYSIKAVRVLDTRHTSIQKQPEMLLCLVGISHRYYLGDELYPTTNCRPLTVDMDLFNLIRALNPTKVKTGSRPRAPHEVPLLTLTPPRVIEMDEPAATDSSGVPSTIERSPLDFAHEAGASDHGTAALEMPSSEDVPATTAPGAGQAEETATMDPSAAPKSCKRDRYETDVNAPPKSMRRDHADPRPFGSSHEGKSLAAIQLSLASTVVVPEDAPVGVSNPYPLSFVDASSRHPVDVAQSSPGIAATGDPKSENASSPAEVGSPGSVYQPKWGVTNGSLLDTPEACQDLVDHVAPPSYFSELRHMHNEEFLRQYNVNLAWQVAMGSQLRLRFEQEAKLLRKSVAQVARQDKRIQARELEIRNLKASLEAEANAKRAAEDKSAGLSQELESMRAQFSDLQDERVEQRCAEMDARLDALSIDFDEELYPHMLTATAGRRWVIGRGLRLAVMKCGMGFEHGQAQRSLESIEAYDSEAKAKFVAALQDIRDLRPSSSQLTILVYPEVRDPWNPWACKEEIGLADAIATNISRAEKKKKCRIVCHTHGVGSAHHARSDGVPVSAPTVVPRVLPFCWRTRPRRPSLITLSFCNIHSAACGT
nr:putative reverse transcriptase domain-containing protein [Tanacetum cinerariifolium]